MGFPGHNTSRVRRRYIATQTQDDLPIVEESPRSIPLPVSRRSRVIAPRFLAREESAPLASVQRMLSGPQPVVWLFTGDGTTLGAMHTDGQRSFSEHFSERVRWEMRRQNDVVINTGISGDSSVKLLEQLDARVLRFQPDVVFLMTGMNDSILGDQGRGRFRKTLKKMLARFKQASILPVLMTPPFVSPNKDPQRSDLPAYVEIVRGVAEEQHLALIDHWAHWDRLHHELDDVRPWFSRGTIHPSATGHRELAGLIFHSLEIYDPSSPTCEDRF